MRPAKVESLASESAGGDDDRSGLLRIAGNAAYNVVGQILPAVVMLAVLPLLLHGLGTARFGLFSILWAILGSCTIFNLGLPRAATKFVAEKRQRDNKADVCGYVWGALALNGVFGCLFGAAVLLLRHPIVSALKIPPPLVPEAYRGLGAVGVGVPVTVLFQGLRGVLEGYQLFRAVNVVRVATETVGFGGAGLLAYFGAGVASIVGFVVLVRAAAGAVYLAIWLRMPGTGLRFVAVTAGVLRDLVSYGMWVGVSDLLAPILAYSDRFVLSAGLSVSAVAYLSIPQEIVARVWILPISAVGAVFPVFSQLTTDTSGDRDLLYLKVVKGLLVLTGIPVLLLFFSGRDVLSIWMGPALAEHSAGALRILLAGVLLAVPAPVTTSLLRGVGQPRIVAVLQAIEAPFYLVGLWLMVKWAGVDGAALAWSARWFLHMTLLLWAAFRSKALSSSHLLKQSLRKTSVVGVVALAIATAELAAWSGPILYPIMAGSIAAFLLWIWTWVLDAGEKQAMTATIGSLTGFPRRHSYGD